MLPVNESQEYRYVKIKVLIKFKALEMMCTCVELTGKKKLRKVCVPFAKHVKFNFIIIILTCTE